MLLATICTTLGEGIGVNLVALFLFGILIFLFLRLFTSSYYFPSLHLKYPHLSFLNPLSTVLDRPLYQCEEPASYLSHGKSQIDTDP
jgi:hypothetical protein